MAPFVASLPPLSWWRGPIPSQHQEAGLNGVQGRGWSLLLPGAPGVLSPKGPQGQACQLLPVQKGSDGGALALTRNSSSSCVGLGGRRCRACRLRGRPAVRRKCSVTSWGVRTEQMGSTAPRDRTSSIRATLEPRLPRRQHGWPRSPGRPSTADGGLLVSSRPRGPRPQHPCPSSASEEALNPAAASSCPHVPFLAGPLKLRPTPRPGGSGPLEGCSTQPGAWGAGARLTQICK